MLSQDLLYICLSSRMHCNLVSIHFVNIQMVNQIIYFHFVFLFPEYLKNLCRFAKQYDRKIFRMWLAGDYHAVLSHPKDIEVILSSTEVLLKRGIYDFLRPWLGDGLLTSYSTKWHTHRKMITPSFHFQILKEFLGNMNKTSSKFVEKLKVISKDEKIFDVQEIVHKCTLDIICGNYFCSCWNSF